MAGEGPLSNGIPVPVLAPYEDKRPPPPRGSFKIDTDKTILMRKPSHHA